MRTEPPDTFKLTVLQLFTERTPFFSFQKLQPDAGGSAPVPSSTLPGVNISDGCISNKQWHWERTDRPALIAEEWGYAATLFWLGCRGDRKL